MIKDVAGLGGTCNIYCMCIYKMYIHACMHAYIHTAKNGHSNNHIVYFLISFAHSGCAG